MLHHIRSWSTFSNFSIQIFWEFWQSPQILKICDDGGLNKWISSWNHRTLSVPLRRSWLEVCRWITSLAGGSSCRGNVGWLDMAPSIQLSLRLKRHIKWCATAIRVVITFLSVSARRSVELDDDKVVSEYEEDWPERGIGSAIRVSCPSYLGPSWQFLGNFRKVHKFWNFGTREALMYEYCLEIIEHYWKYSISHCTNWILKFEKFQFLGARPYLVAFLVKVERCVIALNASK